MTTKLPINLEDLLRQRTVEGERIEYKAGWNPDASIRTICAFANDFHNLGHSAIRPQYHPLSASYMIDGRTILVLSVPGGEVRPYKVRISVTHKSSEWAYYIRKQASTVRTTGEDERELLGLAATVPFDDRYNQSTTLDNLSPQLIKEFLEELELTEGRSTGIPKIFKALAANGSPAPEFDTDEDRSYFITRLLVHPKAGGALLSGARSGQSQDQVTGEVGAHDGAHDEAHEPINGIEWKILELCSDQPRNTHDLLRALGYETRTGNFKRALTRVLNAGFLEMTVPDKPRTKKQRYRLTDKGRQWLKEGGKAP